MLEDGPGWDEAEDAIRWGRERAPQVYIRVGGALPQTYYSAGEVNASEFPPWPDNG